MGYVVKMHPCENRAEVIRVEHKSTDHFLRFMQKQVRGYIETVSTSISPEYLLICDDEGAIKNKPVNIMASCIMSERYAGHIFGEALIVKVNGEDLVPLDSKEVVDLLEDSLHWDWYL